MEGNVTTVAKNLVTIDIADMKVSNKADDVLITYSLGSCIGVVIYDPEIKAGGLLHYMLPDSSISPEKAKEKPYMFADTGIPILFKSLYKLGAEKQRIIVKVAGGSQIMDAKGVFNIGKRNYLALRKILWRNNVMITTEDIGGYKSRTLSIEIATGRVFVKKNKEVTEL